MNHENDKHLQDEIQRLTAENERLTAENQRIHEDAKWFGDRLAVLEHCLDMQTKAMLGITQPEAN